MQPAEITFASLQPLLAGTVQEGEQLKCTFVCPATFEEVSSKAPLVRSGILGRAFESAGRHLPNALRWGIWRGVLRKFGYGFLGEFTGNLLGDVVEDVTREQVASRQKVFSREEHESAAVEAFKRVADRFHWDGERWVTARVEGDLATDFSRQLSRQPVRERFDLQVLARLLLELARSDHRRAQEETDFIHTFLVPRMALELGSLERYPALRATELEQVASKDSLLMLGWGLALTDIALDPAEGRLLQEFALGLGLPAQRAATLRRYAECYLVDEALEQLFNSDRWDDGGRDAIGELGSRLGLNPTEVDRVVVAFQKRTGRI